MYARTPALLAAFHMRRNALESAADDVPEQI
jgi:hypothetical protein